jgi:hypothetical protein
VRFFLLLTVLTTISLTTEVADAYAQMIPRYDVETYCRRVASVSGGYSSTIDGACRDQEQAAYDVLARKWPGSADDHKTFCDQVARVGGGGSYSILSTCLDQEAAASQRNAIKHFDYHQNPAVASKPLGPAETAKAAEQICASYTPTPDGEIARDKCKTVLRLKLGRWLAIIPLIGDVDYVALCAPHRSPAGRYRRWWLDKAI